jgi:acyl-CoA synthetase (AMP-forming)/AMP-acid ligase II
VVTAKTTLYTVPCESIFNQHPAVSRSALVGVGPRNRRAPVMVIERVKNGQGLSKTALTGELLTLAGRYEITKCIRTILYHKSFPVDIRHNSKIFREKLSVWAERQVGPDPIEEASE